MRPERESRKAIEFLEEKLGVHLEPSSEVLSVGKLGNFRRYPVEGRLFFIGDACELFDPIGGMGMTHALFTAQALAPRLSAILERPSEREILSREYARLQNECAKRFRGFTRLTYLLLVTLGHTGLSEYLGCSPLARWISSGVHGKRVSLSSRLSDKVLAVAGL
jgi:flavin-dependent dehydrogenase